MSKFGRCVLCGADLECRNPDCEETDEPPPDPLDPLRSAVVAAALKWAARQSDAAALKLTEAVRAYTQAGGR